VEVLVELSSVQFNTLFNTFSEVVG